MFSRVSPCTRWLISCADHALQFGARQALERAARDGDHGVVGAPAGGEGVDRVVARAAPRPRAAGVRAAERDLLHDVGEAPFEPAALRRVAEACAGRAPASRATCAPPSRRRSVSIQQPPSTNSSTSAVLVSKNSVG